MNIWIAKEMFVYFLVDTYALYCLYLSYFHFEFLGDRDCDFHFICIPPWQQRQRIPTDSYEPQGDDLARQLEVHRRSCEVKHRRSSAKFKAYLCQEVAPVFQGLMDNHKKIQVFFGNLKGRKKENPLDGLHGELCGRAFSQLPWVFLGQAEGEEGSREHCNFQALFHPEPDCS